MTDNLTYTLSIEPYEGPSYLYSAHLGTLEDIARACAVDVYKNANQYAGNGYWHGAKTVALFRAGRMYDCFMGDRWSSEYANMSYED